MNLFYRCIRKTVLLLIKRFYHHRSFGVDHIPKGGAIIIANHASVLDPPLVAASWPHEIAFLARSGLFKIQWLAWAIKRLNAFPLSESSSDLKAMRLVGNLVKEGKQVLIFPEGERSWNDTLLPFKPGATTLACRFNCPIIPCYIAGSHAAWPRGKKRPQLSAKTACVIGQPILPSNYNHLKRKERAQAMQHTLEEKVKKLRSWYETNNK